MQFKNPVISTNNHRLTSQFGKRADPITGRLGVQHDGVDIVDAAGLQRTQDIWCTAIANGTVVEKWNGAEIGHGVDILHAGNILTRQYHFKSASPLKVGDKVKKGDRTGIMGTTGRSTGIHLHFGVKINSTRWNNGTYVDPAPYLNGSINIGGSSSAAIKVNDKVRINASATVYATGQHIPAFVKNNTYTVQQVNNDRALLREISSWVSAGDLISVSSSISVTPQSAFKIGDRVRVNQGAKTYTGGTLASFVFNNTYEIAQITGDRAVVGTKNTAADIIDITAAVNVRDLTRV